MGQGGDDAGVFHGQMTVLVKPNGLLGRRVLHVGRPFSIRPRPSRTTTPHRTSVARAVRLMAAMDTDDAHRAADLLRTTSVVTELRRAAEEGMSVVASSPFRLGHKAHIARVADIVEPLDRALRTTRVLVRQAAIINRHGLVVPASYVTLTADLADAAETLADGFAGDQLGEEAREPLITVGRATSTVERTHVMSAAVVLMQLRSLVADLLVLTGMDQFEAADSLPPPPEETDGFSDTRP